ncbi:hypothetical protein OG949_04100 [Streptomyces scopuliridis]|uniref:hypothetical protein n=1 Tax=Streptomyces scopuliridis TaxID=452529 RepID=UPI002DD9B252|nr:hypothetical protein [Streptomyces scopuliridis]WSB32122.1 hypothetical protein OG949_04100 [Streptomyces scopuliridis]
MTVVVRLDRVRVAQGPQALARPAGCEVELVAAQEVDVPITTTTTTAAVIQQDGTILADAPDSPSLTVLRDRLKQWEDAGRPAPATFTPALVPTGGGWDLRLSR